MQNTFSPDFVRHTFDLVKATQSYDVYELRSCTGQPTLTPLCRIEKFFGKSNAYGIEKYFRMRTTTSWNTSEKVTGLREYTSGIYYGNRLFSDKKSLMIFLISEDKNTLIIDYYRAFYPNTPTILNDILAGKKKERI